MGPGAATPVKPGFWVGFSSLFGGLGFVVGTPRTWPFALVPGLVFGVLLLLFGWAAVSWLRPALSAWLAGDGAEMGWLALALAGAVSWLGTLLAVLLGGLLAFALAPPLSGPALERIVEAQERALGIPPRAPIGFFAEIWCGLRAQAFAAVFLLPVLALLFLLDLLFPPATVVTTPLKVVATGLGLAWNLYDYPLTLRGTRMRDRFELVLRNKRATLGFGLAFAALFWVPCFNVLMLPVGVAAATRLMWRIAQAQADLAPRLLGPGGALGLGGVTPPLDCTDSTEVPADALAQNPLNTQPGGSRPL